MQKNKTIIFFGTPLIASKCLQALVDLGYKIPFIVCQPDKPVGRKREVIFSESKKLALKSNIKVLQPNKLSEITNDIKDANPDLILTCAYGKIIPEQILNIPKYRCVNVHASLLPKYRGGAPIHWSIINGEKETGISLMFMEKGMDSGNIILQEKITINENDNLDSIFIKMEELAYKIVTKNISKLFDLELIGEKQNDNDISYAYCISRENEKINWNKTAENIKNHIRGLSTAIGAFTNYEDKIIKIFEVKILKSISKFAPGTIVNNNKQLFITTLTNEIEILSMQIAGKKIQNKEQIASTATKFAIGTKFN